MHAGRTTGRRKFEMCFDAHSDVPVLDPHERLVQGRGDYVVRMSDKELQVSEDRLTNEDGRTLAATFMRLGVAA